MSSAAGLHLMAVCASRDDVVILRCADAKGTADCLRILRRAEPAQDDRMRADRCSIAMFSFRRATSSR